MIKRKKIMKVREGREGRGTRLADSVKKRY